MSTDKPAISGDALTGPFAPAFEYLVDTGQRSVLFLDVTPARRSIPRAHPGQLATRAASGIPDFDELMDKAQTKAPARSLVSIDDVGAATAFLALDGAKADHR